MSLAVLVAVNTVFAGFFGFIGYKLGRYAGTIEADTKWSECVKDYQRRIRESGCNGN